MCSAKLFFRLWNTLADDFDPRVINFGFGGSTIEARDHFFARLIPPVDTRSLLLYACHLNDLILQEIESLPSA